MVEDINSNIKTLNSQKDGEENFPIVAMSMPNVIITTDINGIIIFSNDGIKDVFGYSNLEILGKSISKLMPERFRTEFFKGFKKFQSDKMLGTGKVINAVGLKKDGTQFPFEMSLSTYNVGKDIYLTTIIRDITERIKTEKALKASQLHLEDAMDLAHLANWQFDMSINQYIFNDRFYSMFGTTAEEEGGYNMSVQDYLNKYIHPEDTQSIADGMKKTKDSNFCTELEHKIIRGDGKIRYMAVHCRTVDETDNHGPYAYGTIQDITEIKMVEKKLKESVKEKEILLKEIHHRVKNNMQIISSLLNIQTRYLDDEESINVLKESQNRVKSMAMIHEKLYGSSDFNKIYFDDYIESLVWDLFYSYSIEKGTINPILEIDDVKLNIETSIPCGLIITELVSNSLKYAFPNQLKGELKVSLKNKDDHYKLIISDNGIGFPKNIDFKNTKSLGLELVNNLVEQIDGNIQLENSKGTKFKITFKELEYKERI
jgi:PAS domain S-box-containing protein